MENQIKRLEKITIENFKNVKQGSIELENKRKDFKASVLGIYGQNGSGKTALVDAIQLLKYALCGLAIPAKYVDFINVDAGCATLKFDFLFKEKEDTLNVSYQFSIRRTLDSSVPNMDETSVSGGIEKTELFDEILEYVLILNDERTRKKTLIDTRNSNMFVPKSSYNELVGNDKSIANDIIVNKQLVKAQSRSFVFSREMIKIFREHCSNELYVKIINELVVFGNRELFIINTENSGLISMNALPIAFKYNDGKTETFGNLMLPLNPSASAPIPEEAYDIVEKVIGNMNIVLKQIVPGLTIGIDDLGPVVYSDGKHGRQIQLISLKSDKRIPFQYESEGIKKIVSILQLLIVVYNSSSITVAIDELDGGVFEYLLGEILRILSEKGKGQLIFTSHNLRPLETIDKGFIAFTTTNPEHRYIRMTNVKGNNNLRDFYYRDIVLGEQNEQVYNPTNNYEIALAFREAGESFGS